MAIGVGIIGLGMAVTPHMLALQDLVRAGRARIIGGHAPSAARRDAFVARWAAPVFATPNALLDAPGLDLVLILAPPGEHLPIAERVAAAGKHMIVEKPLERTMTRAEALVAVADQAGIHAAVCFQHRFRPGALELARRLRAGELGRPLSASASIRWWRDANYFAQPGRGTLARDGGGVLLTQAIHSLDLFRSLVGVSRVVAAQARTTALHRMETEDYVSALMETGNGAPATLVTTTAAYPGYPERIEITGTKGFAALIGGRLRLAYLDEREEIVEAEGSTGSGANIMDFPHDAHRAVIADFLDAIEQGRDPVVTGEEALASQRLVDDILRAARQA